MRFESITIHNFRQYKDVEFNFPKNSENDLHIIIGQNGTGKTNLLNAITWCLYGKEKHLGNISKAQPIVNNKALYDAIDNGETTVKVSVEIVISEYNEYITFLRELDFTATKKPFAKIPKFSVHKMPENIYFEKDEEIGNIVNQYLPEIINEYFFFDGEQLDKYFISDDNEKIKNAIHNISQVNLVTSIHNRLYNIIKLYQDQAGKGKTKIGVINTEKNNIEDNINDWNKKLEECKKEIVRAEGIITECTEYLSGKEGIPEKEEEFKNISETLEKLEKERDSNLKELYSFIKEYTIIFSFYNDIKKTIKIINVKENNGDLPPRIDKHLLEKMLKEHICTVCQRPLSFEDEFNVRSILNKISLSTGVSSEFVSIKGSLETYTDLARSYKEKRNNILNRKIQLDQQINELKEKSNNIYKLLLQFDDKEKIKNIADKRAEFIRIKRLKDNEKIRLEMNIEEGENNLEEVKSRLAQEIARDQELQNLRNKISFAERARNVALDVEKEIMNKVRDQMTYETMDIFKSLGWKTKTFSKLILDDNYILELYDKYDLPMVGSCSAAERALLALSFTLALQKVSGYQSMLFIDTPVGRVDVENRKRFSNVLKNVSVKKQVIMTFTTSEYSDEVRKAIESCASSYKELYTENEEMTVVING